MVRGGHASAGQRSTARPRPVTGRHGNCHSGTRQPVCWHGQLLLLCSRVQHVWCAPAQPSSNQRLVPGNQVARRDAFNHVELARPAARPPARQVGPQALPPVPTAFNERRPPAPDWRAIQAYFALNLERRRAVVSSGSPRRCQRTSQGGFTALVALWPAIPWLRASGAVTPPGTSAFGVPGESCVRWRAVSGAHAAAAAVGACAWRFRGRGGDQMFLSGSMSASAMCSRRSCGCWRCADSNHLQADLAMKRPSLGAAGGREFGSDAVSSAMAAAPRLPPARPGGEEGLAK